MSIVKTDTYRILIPSEYLDLRASIKKTRLRILIDTLLYTGMRFSELERFAKNPEWFDMTNRAISLPAKATKTHKDRVIHLTPQFAKDLSLHLLEHKKLEVPTIRSMEANLKRWGAKALVKTFRKTWESWLLSVRREDGSSKYSSFEIAKSQGHSELVSYGHYANLDPRLKSEMELVRKLTEGWGT